MKDLILFGVFFLVGFMIVSAAQAQTLIGPYNACTETETVRIVVPVRYYVPEINYQIYPIVYATPWTPTGRYFYPAIQQQRRQQQIPLLPRSRTYTSSSLRLIK